MAVKFYIEKRKTAQGANNETPIVTSISICGSRFLTSIGYRIAPEKWDEKLQRVKKGCSNNKGIAGTNINAKIDKIKAVFAIFESECINNKKATDKAKIKAVFAANFGKEFVKTAKASDVFSVFDAFVCRESASQKWAASTTQKWSTIKKHLQDFDSKLTFESFNNDKLNEYTQYLQNDLGLRNSTMKKNITFLKWFLKWATLHGFNKNKDFETYKPKFKDTTEKAVIFLTDKEFLQLYNYDFSNNKCFEQIRDVFCFLCKTGLRYSDVANLKRSNVFDNFIDVVTIKTRDKIRIELNKYSRQILDKYKDFQFADNMALPVISNQKMNNYLKSVCLIAGIDTPITITYYKGAQRIDETFPKWQLIGTHAGRRTFICYALAHGIPPQVVMKWTGHSDYKAMKPYIDITDATKENAMKIFDE